jgi:hypothetical protein
MSKSFNLSGGILICGASYHDVSLYFVILSDTNAHFALHEVNLRFAGKANSIVYVIEGGSVDFEYVRMNKQYNDNWVNPLVDVNSSGLVNVFFFSVNITDCYYVSTVTSTFLYKSGIIFFSDSSTETKILNISACHFCNNSFYLSDWISACGGMLNFNGSNNSCINFDFFFFLHLHYLINFFFFFF